MCSSTVRWERGKNLREQRAVRILVFDNNFVPKDSVRFPRWQFRRGPAGRSMPTGWRSEGSRLVHARPESGPTDRYDWAEYHHWDPERQKYAPVRDFIGYNGLDVRAENAVADLMFEGRVAAGADVPSIAVRIDSGADRFLVEIPVVGAANAPEACRARRNGQPLALSHPRGGIRRTKGPDHAAPLLEVSVMDRQLTVAVDGELLFDPVDYDIPKPGPGPNDSAIGIGAKGGSLALSDIRIFRDVYYTSALAYSPRRPFGVDSPYVLGPDEFFVLGDNSPVSNDSRFWVGSPVVAGDLFLGKPFLVHLPGQAVPLQVFGRSVYWVPDPREIRYIR